MHGTLGLQTFFPELYHTRIEVCSHTSYYQLWGKPSKKVKGCPRWTGLQFRVTSNMNVVSRSTMNTSGETEN